MESLIWTFIIFFIVIPLLSRLIKVVKSTPNRNSVSTTPTEKPDSAGPRKLAAIIAVVVILAIGSLMFIGNGTDRVTYFVTIIVIAMLASSVMKFARRTPAKRGETPALFRLDPLQDQMSVLRSLRSTPQQRADVIGRLQAKGDQTSRNLILRAAVHDPDVMVQNSAFQALSELMGGTDKAEVAVRTYKTGKPDAEPWFQGGSSLYDEKGTEQISTYAAQNIDPFRERSGSSTLLIVLFFLGILIAGGAALYFYFVR